jgi:eukaryotic-like serine/threonine-protein kinase
MTPERMAQMERLFHEALAQPATSRAEFLAQACGEDHELRDSVARLLAADATRNDIARDAIAGTAAGALNLTQHGREGELLGPWRVLDCIGRGGMGTVHRGERADGQFELQVAIKLLDPGALDRESLARFEAERRILARLSHPAIARFYDGGTTPDGVPYLVMEFVEGRPIDAWCREHAPNWRARVRLLQRICEAVDYAHRNLVVHRDLKPSNVLVDANGDPKLLDFGVAKLIDDGSLPSPVTVLEQRALTPRYASPEQVRGDPVSIATDVYSLGVLSYEVLTGQLPYPMPASGLLAWRLAICETEPTRPSEAARRNEGPPTVAPGGARRAAPALPADLDDVLLMALRKEPERRYPSAAALAQDFAALLEHRPVVARRASAGYRARRFLRRHRAASAVGVTAAAALGGFGFFHVERVTAERDRAVRAEALATAEAQVARAVEDFVIGVFSAIDPSERGGGADVTARELLDRAVANLSMPGTSAEAASTRITLAMTRAYGALRLPEQTRALAERVLADLSAAGQQQTADAAVAHSMLSMAAALEDRWDEAIESGETAVKLFEATRGPRSLEVARALNLVSPFYLVRDRRREQVAAAERAHAILLEVAGPDALETLDAATLLGGAWTFAERLEEGLALAQQARAAYDRILGPGHPRSLRSLHIAALTLPKLGRPEEGLKAAEDMLQASLTANRGDPANPRLATAHRMIYFNAADLGDVKRAYDATLAGIEVNLAAVAPSLSDMAFSTSNLAHLMIGLGNLDQASVWNTQSQRVAETIDPTCRSTMFSYRHMYAAIIARERGDLAAARREARLAVEADLRSMSPTDPEVLKKRMHQDLVEARLGDRQRASTGLTETVRLYDATLGPDHPDAAQALGYLAQASAALGRDELADEQFATSLQRLGKAVRDTNPTYVELLRAYVAFAAEKRGATAAAPRRAQLADIERRRPPLTRQDLARLDDLASRLARDRRFGASGPARCGGGAGQRTQ